MAALLGLTTAPTSIEEVIVGGYYQENDGGGGSFIWKTGTATNDSGTIFGGSLLTGGLTGGYFQRLIPDGIINAKWFGARGDGSTNDTTAFEKISAYINAKDGGELIIPEGTYIVGEQTQATGTGQGYSFLGKEILSISNCTKSVTVRGIGSGAVLKVADGLYFGSFVPGTTTRYDAPAGGFVNADYKASIGNVLSFLGNSKVVVENMTVDGNIPSLIIGGYWGDVGYQIGAYGFYFEDNDDVRGSNLVAKENALDGFLVKNWRSGKQYRASFDNIASMGNGRQGLSCVSTNHLQVTNSRFENTGRTVNSTYPGAFGFAPGCGISLECEDAPITNTYFENCVCDNNVGAGLSITNATPYESSDHHFERCKFIGATNWSILPSGGKRTTFSNCMVAGMGGVFYPADGFESGNGVKCVACHFSMDTSLSPTGLIYTAGAANPYVLELGGTFPYALFAFCAFDGSTDGSLPVTIPDTVIFHECSFRHLSTTHQGYPRGIYTGLNHFKFPFTSPLTIDFNGSKFFGDQYVKDVLTGDEIQGGTTAASSNFQSIVRGLDISGATVALRTAHTSGGPAHFEVQNGGARRGDIVLKTNPAAGDFVGWICTVGGAQGSCTWQPFGTVGKAAAPSASLTTLSSTYDQTEVQALRDELDSLRTVLRNANIIS
jgi:hypothetical protein